MPPNIKDYITEQESNFETEEITLGDNWNWNMRKHIQMIFHLKNGIFYTGENDWLRAFKNIMEPLLELSYWTEDIEVKDIVFEIEERGSRALSFLIKKYHDEVYTRKHNIDTMIDEIAESDIDYGGALVQKGKDCPEVLKLKHVAFCDQTDILGGPLGIKFFFSPDKLRKMSKSGWGEESNGATISLEELCILATPEKDSGGALNKNKNQVTGKNVEVYIVRGNLPEHYLKDNNNMEDHYNQLLIVALYTGKDKQKQGVFLFRKKEDEGNLKFFTSKEVEDRALGRGMGERLLGPQIWTNFLTIHKTAMLEAGSKSPLYTDDPTYTQKNKIDDMENNEITTIEDGKQIRRVPTMAIDSIQLYEGSINEWYVHAQSSSQANDPIMGVEQVSGTTFRGQERTVAQGRGPHDRRKGKRAKFVEEIYRDEIIPDIVKEITKGKKFLATLSVDEMQWVADEMSTNLAEKRTKELILQGKMLTQQDKDTMKSIAKELILKKGNKQLLEILKGEFEDIEIKIGINIAGKQKNLANLSDKVLSIFQFIFQNPAGFQQAMQIPALANSFNDLLEFSGLSIADFSSLLQAPPMQPIQSPLQPQQQQQPMLATNTQLQ